MEKLIQYVLDHTRRGECQCGKCIDGQPDSGAPPHSVNVHFFWVAPLNKPKKEAFLALLKAEYPDFERLKSGPSYIELSGLLGSQEIALRFIGLGALVDLWAAITPEALHFTEEQADELAGKGLVMVGGF